jgi:hypothetical protein
MNLYYKTPNAFVKYVNKCFVQTYTPFSFSFSTALTADCHRGPFAKSMLLIAGLIEC